MHQFRGELLNWLCEEKKKTYLPFSQNCLSLGKMELFLKAPDADSPILGCWGDKLIGTRSCEHWAEKQLIWFFQSSAKSQC